MTVSTTDLERDDDLDGLSSEELEAQAFGPDPSRTGRRWGLRRTRRGPARPPRDRPTAPLVVVTKHCYACGETMDAAARDCPDCGVRQPRVPRRRGRLVRRGDRRANPSKPTATLLALVLGGVGAHRLYLGQTKTGLAMLLFFWTSIPFWIGVVDFVRYVRMTDREFAERYGGAGGAVALPPPRPALAAGHDAGGVGEDPAVRVVR